MTITQEPPKPDPNTYWLVPGKLLAGEYPGARDPEEARQRLRKFLDAGVRHFIDLTEPSEDLEPYAGLLADEAGSGMHGLCIDRSCISKMTLDRYRGALLGLAAGDALGTTLEFKPPGSFAPLAT